jgi:hypothetical protein
MSLMMLSSTNNRPLKACSDHLISKKRLKTTLKTIENNINPTQMNNKAMGTAHHDLTKDLFPN